MTRPVQAQGRPGTVVVPDGWGASHAAVIDRSHTSTVSIGPAGGAPAWNPTAKQTETPAATPVYVGGATLMLLQVRGDRVESVVDDPASMRLYDVTLPYAASAAVTVGHVITVAASDMDPVLAGATLRITGIEAGSRRFSRVLLAVLNT